MSLGMRFARRRMMAAAKKEPKYVWAVYDFAYVWDEEKATTGSFSATRTRTKMAASAYTVNEGGFTLTGATTTSLQNLTVGKFLVDIGTTSNSTATTGQYLYEVTGKSGSYTTTVQYKRYGVKAARGENELYRVESDTADYPVDGEQDGLWYVMLKGEIQHYVWERYDVVCDLYAVSETKVTESVAFYDGDILYGAYGPSINFDTANGYASMTYPTMYLASEIPNRSDLASKHDVWCKNEYERLKTIYIGFSAVTPVYKADGSWSHTEVVSSSRYDIVPAQGYPYSKGSKVGTVESDNSAAYPQDALQGAYWYTYSHSYTEEFDNR